MTTSRHLRFETAQSDGTGPRIYNPQALGSLSVAFYARNTTSVIFDHAPRVSLQLFKYLIPSYVEGRQQENMQ
jgi:hypothetical protein